MWWTVGSNPRYTLSTICPPVSHFARVHVEDLKIFKKHHLHGGRRPQRTYTHLPFQAKEAQSVCFEKQQLCNRGERSIIALCRDLFFGGCSQALPPNLEKWGQPGRRGGNPSPPTAPIRLSLPLTHISTLTILPNTIINIQPRPRAKFAVATHPEKATKHAFTEMILQKTWRLGAEGESSSWWKWLVLMVAVMVPLWSITTSLAPP